MAACLPHRPSPCAVPFESLAKACVQQRVFFFLSLTSTDVELGVLMSTKG